jgi:hypothetical protein
MKPAALVPPKPNVRKAGMKQWRHAAWLLIPIVVVLAWPVWDIRVVDVIPESMAKEDEYQMEVALAVDPADADRMLATALFLGRATIECDERVAGVVVSMDNGKTWTLECALPLVSTSPSQWDYIGDPSLDIVGTGSNAYGAYLTPAWPDPEQRARLFQAADLFSGTYPIVAEYKETDQPQVNADHGGGSNDVAISASVGEGMTGCADDGDRDAVIYLAPSTANPVCFQQRPAAMEIPSVRSAWHPSGTVYTVFFLPDYAKKRTDVVVEKGVRDALGVIHFGAIKDDPVTVTGDSCTSRDGKAGFRLVRCAIFPYQTINNPEFGQERRTLSQLAVAVHPDDPAVVYVAWGDSLQNDASRMTLHVRGSTDGGKTWDATDRLTVPNATNPALAVATDGSVGVAYQRLLTSAGELWWSTELVVARADFSATRTITLVQSKAAVPAAVQVPYLGDYMTLTAVGRRFFGSFAASNDFAANVYPHGVLYVRDAPDGTIPITMDPYVFAAEKRWYGNFARIARYLEVAMRR